jgi:hypothetical protein
MFELSYVYYIAFAHKFESIECEEVLKMLFEIACILILGLLLLVELVLNVG